MPLALCSMKPALTVEPEVKVVVAVPDGVVVCAVLVIVCWLGTPVPVDPPTVRVAVPTLLLLSVAVTVTSPFRPVGTVTYVMNEPPVFASRFAGTVVTTCPSTWMTIGELGVKPLPMTCIVLPAPAVDGVIWTTGADTLNAALAVFPIASVIVSVFVASDVTGMVNVVAAAIAPVEVVVVVLRTTAAPFIFAVSALVAANPVPVTVTVVPLLPVVGETVIDGATEIVVCAVRPVFESVRVRRYVPANNPDGTMNHVSFVYAFAPVLETVIPPNWSTPLTCSTTLATTKGLLPNVALEMAVNPVTVMETLLPDAAIVGAVIWGAPSTVIVVDAVSIGVLTPAVPIVNCSVYVSAVTLAGTTNFTPAVVPNDPVLATVTDA